MIKNDKKQGMKMSEKPLTEKLMLAIRWLLFILTVNGKNDA